ncbi:hypothetical protein AB0D04_26160 [Streptomyces sp. NPDC048483]|uniref:hypothetical protein n=1 Tax=Streptomyces sp. NPDC048483 TaxID=3154927 RepID=UPI003445C798
MIRSNWANSVAMACERAMATDTGRTMTMTTTMTTKPSMSPRRRHAKVAAIDLHATDACREDHCVVTAVRRWRFPARSVVA